MYVDKDKKKTNTEFAHYFKGKKKNKTETYNPNVTKDGEIKSDSGKVIYKS